VDFLAQPRQIAAAGALFRAGPSRSDGCGCVFMVGIVAVSAKTLAPGAESKHALRR
jgi:hypothetical protein